MSMEDYYEVGNTGMFFGDGHKGGFSIVFKENEFFYMDYRIDGICDCIYGIYEALEDAPLTEKYEKSFVMKYEWLIRETAKKVWDNNVNYFIPKCFECTLKKTKRNIECLYCEGMWEGGYNIAGSFPTFDFNKYYERVDTMLREGY